MIAHDHVVTMTYTLRGDDGDLIDQADKDSPFSYLHGRGQIVSGLEKALMGLKVGAKKVISVSPGEGYGEHDPELVTKASKSQFPGGAELEVGMQFMAQGEEGHHLPFTVVEISGDNVVLDGNHPLAGKTLHFDIEVLEVRPASKQEIDHGHAHGPHGHNH